MKSAARFLILLAAIFSLLPSTSTLSAAPWTDEERSLVMRCEGALSYRRFVQLIDAAERLSEAALETHNRETADMALAFSLYGSIIAEKDSMIEQMAAEASKLSIFVKSINISNRGC